MDEPSTLTRVRRPIHHNKRSNNPAWGMDSASRIPSDVAVFRGPEDLVNLLNRI